jgi:phosphomannomutase
VTKIKFGTDGWRAIIAQEFTVDNVARVTEATARWLKKNNRPLSVVVGHDCRFAGELFGETVAKVFNAHGVKVYLAKGFVSTPMISLATATRKAALGIIITASHNPPSYNGYKIKGPYGGPLTPELVQEIEDMIPERAADSWQKIHLQGSLIEQADIEKEYIDRVRSSFDLDAINRSGLRFAYDAMFGAGQRAMLALFPGIIALHCEDNPGFMGQAPEPIDKNLAPFANLIKEDGKIDCGLATDGDADRLGLYDAKGNFIDSHHIILLLVHYLVKYKGMKGKVVVAFSVSGRLKKLCAHYGLELQVVKIGFKYICGIMVTDDVLLGGEESGGIAIKGHIPERDGIWIGLTIWEFMAKTGKSLDKLIEEVYAITGPFCFARNDMHIDEATKARVLSRCAKGEYKTFGKFAVKRVEDLDGVKFFFDDNTWMMIRASGTEPVLRVYAEASDEKQAADILDSAEKVLLAP